MLPLEPNSQTPPCRPSRTAQSTPVKEPLAVFPFPFVLPEYCTLPNVTHRIFQLAIEECHLIASHTARALEHSYRFLNPSQLSVFNKVHYEYEFVKLRLTLNFT